MTIEEIKELIRVAQESGVAELEVRRGDNSVRVTIHSAKRSEVVFPTVVPVSVTPGAAIAAQDAFSAVAPPPATQAVIPPATPAADEDQNALVVKSPIVGTYYDCPSPGTAPFVKVGDQVHPKQVLCIIESMKLMNEIEAEVGGTIIAKLIENGRPVEYGESLFKIRPL
jgi:acetyl-CoA carboxylase biotin carboxyl carrier protein